MTAEREDARNFIMENQNSTKNNLTDFQDIVTPFGSQLKGIYKRSFAYKTIKERMPAILTRIIDSLSHEEWEIVEKYGKSSANELHQVIAEIRRLKDEIVANEPLPPLVASENESATNCSKIKIWNDYAAERANLEGRVPTWYRTTWIYCECFMYQRLAQAFALTKTLRNYDPFAKQKREGFDGSIASVIAVATYTLAQVNGSRNISSAELKREFTKLLRLDLWGNRCDLSLSEGVANGQVGNPLDLLEGLEKDILVDDTEFVWDSLVKAQKTNGTITIDIVLDNAGYELFTDLCLAAFLVANNLAHKIRFYVKSVPWFISDVTTEDFHWMIQRMNESSDPQLSQLGQLLKGHLDNGVWTIEDEPFWTYPFVYSEMAERDPVLYAKLSEADFIIFKGDLNYRKLVGDINWEYTTSFLHALEGFLPANFVSLRTIKSDVCVGLKPQQGESLHRKDANWLLTGQYGLIQGTIDVCPCSKTEF